MRLVIEIDPETNAHTVTAESGSAFPAIVHDSVERMADQLTILREVHRGLDVDVIFFSDVSYLSDD